MSEDIGWEIVKLVAPSALALCSGAAIAIFAEPVKQRFFTPSITLDFFPHESAPYPSCHQDGTPNICDVTGHKRTTKNARVRITNNSKRRTAKNCRSYLHRIERYDNQTAQFHLLHGENLPLPWAFADHKPIDIPGGTHFYCDVFYLLSGCDETFLRAYAPHYSWKTAINQTGLYRFTIMAVGDNFPPQKYAFSFNWKENYDLVAPTDFAVAGVGP